MILYKKKEDFALYTMIIDNRLCLKINSICPHLAEIKRYHQALCLGIRNVFLFLVASILMSAYWILITFFTIVLLIKL